MQRKGFLLLALICGLIAAGSIYFFLNHTQRGAQMGTRPLVIAKSNISARSIISAEQLMLKDVPTQGYPQGGATSIQSISGSVALVNLTAGDFIVKSEIEQPANNPGQGSSPGSANLTVPAGERAVSVQINLVSGVAYLVKPGDHVDVLVTMDVQDGANNQTLTSLAAQDVLVLSVSGNMVDDKTKTESQAYTLALSVPQAMAVTLGSEKGSLRLLLRNPANTEQRTDTPFTANQYLDANYFNLYK